MTDGILIIDKPEGITSHDVVSRCRRILGTKKVGHTGTLDPFATGVMVVLVGQSTRLAQFLDKDEKEYEARIRFGFATDTGDLTGTQIGEVAEPPTADQVREVLPRFMGEQMQTPPMYSAKKIDGKKLYELARKGEEVERKAVPIVIGAIEFLGADSDEEMSVRVACSAGTYIRVLAEDIGKSVGCGAHLTALRRTRAGKFGIERAVKLDELEAKREGSETFVSMNEALSHLPEVVLPQVRVTATRSGMSSRIFNEEFADGETLRLLDESGNLIAVGTYSAEEKSVRPRIVLM